MLCLDSGALVLSHLAKKFCSCLISYKSLELSIQHPMRPCLHLLTQPSKLQDMLTHGLLKHNHLYSWPCQLFCDYKTAKRSEESRIITSTPSHTNCLSLRTKKSKTRKVSKNFLLRLIVNSQQKLKMFALILQKIHHVLWMMSHWWVTVTARRELGSMLQMQKVVA